MGGCCIAICGDCCVGNCSDCCVGKSEIKKAERHKEKIMAELKEMRADVYSSAEKREKDILESIDKSMDIFLKEVVALNDTMYGGKRLCLDIVSLAEKNDELKCQVTGCISYIVCQRLVLTDRELSLILQEPGDEKRARSFRAFVDKLQMQAIDAFADKVERNTRQLSEMLHERIGERLDGVEADLNKSLDAYTAALDSKRKDDQTLEKRQVTSMYQSALCDLLLDEMKKSDEVGEVI